MAIEAVLDEALKLRDEERAEIVARSADAGLGVPERDLHLLDAYYYERGVSVGDDPRLNTPKEQAIERESWATIQEGHVEVARAGAHRAVQPWTSVAR